MKEIENLRKQVAAKDAALMNVLKQLYDKDCQVKKRIGATGVFNILSSVAIGLELKPFQNVEIGLLK